MNAFVGDGMSTICGRYVKTFAEANLASMTDVHMNGDYDFFYDVVKVEENPCIGWGGVSIPARYITVKSHKNGKDSTYLIQKDGYGEFFTVEHSGVYQQIFGGGPEKIRVVPFSGEKS